MEDMVKLGQQAGLYSFEQVRSMDYDFYAHDYYGENS